MRRALFALAILLAPGAPAVAGHDPWLELRDGAVALMRHGGAILAEPGTPPPVPGCDPSAVLTDIGREEMKRFGERLRHEGVASARILVSRQCSAWETAKLLGLGRVQHEPSLDSPSGNLTNSEREARREALQRALLAAAAAPEADGSPTILITHRLNISSLTGIEVTQGEVLLLRPQQSGGLVLVGRISSD
jgi:hypothetical protein